MRKLNVSRMQRYVARSTPDQIEARFDRIDSNFDLKYQNWIKRFVYKMKIKYGEYVKIDVAMDEALGQYIGEVVVKAKAFPYTNLRITHRDD